MTHHIHRQEDFPCGGSPRSWEKADKKSNKISFGLLLHVESNGDNGFAMHRRNRKKIFPHRRQILIFADDESGIDLQYDFSLHTVFSAAD